MARKTNYGFERREREKARAAKKAERQRLKQEKSDDRQDETGEQIPSDGTTSLPEDQPTSDKPGES
tara:strand:- start:1016 stop:1213 length:198 start_codon:yes stop_codon:yes gene_type:complete